jgi:hypothetical protein
LEDISEVEDHSKIKQNVAPTPIAQAPPQYSAAQTTKSAVLEPQNKTAVGTQKQAIAQPNKLADVGDTKATYKILRKKHTKKKIKKKSTKNRHQKEDDDDWISVDSAF